MTPFAFCAAVLGVAALNYAQEQQPLSFARSVATVASELIESALWQPGAKIALSVLDEDENCLLPAQPLLQPVLKEVSSRGIELNVRGFNGREQLLVNSLLLGGGGLVEPEPDTLFLSARYRLDRQSATQLFATVVLFTLSARRIYQSDEFSVRAGDCPAQMQHEVFEPIARDSGRLLYRSRLNAQLSQVLGAAECAVLRDPPRLSLEIATPYGVGWQIDELRGVLGTRYGIIWSDTAQGKVTIEQDGSVLFSRFGQQWRIAALVDIEPLLAFSPGADSVYSRTPERSAEFAARAIVTATERTVRLSIEHFFAQRYPRLFSPLDRAGLNALYVRTSVPTVLVGRLLASSASLGTEQVQYQWYYPHLWLDELERGVRERGRSYQVQTQVLALFGDPVEPYRYWAIVEQTWVTRDRDSIEMYRDNGFLIVNFDFDQRARLQECRIHCRLWFHGYRYDDRESGVSRVQKLQADLDRYFVNEIGGMDIGLKQAMASFLLLGSDRALAIGKGVF